MFNKHLISFFFILIIQVIFINFTNQNVAYANSSPYRSAGWVNTDGISGYSNTAGCQISNDGLYCSRFLNSGYGNIYFSSFGDLSDFGIPQYSSIDKLHIRVKGKNTINQNIAVNSIWHYKPFTSSCAITPGLWQVFLGLTDSTVLKDTDTSGNGLTNCITAKNIDQERLTFNLNASGSTPWSADIDNFEIAFDYTPPATPAAIPSASDFSGTVWQWDNVSNPPSKYEGLSNIISIATGVNHSLALKADGTVLAWGSNQLGQLGNGSTGGTFTTPIQVKDPNGQDYLTGVKAISAGNSFSLALKEDGSVWVWGYNSYGHLGIGVNDTYGTSVLNVPTQVPNLIGIKAISAGAFHILALKSDGTVLAWGINDNGQVGNGCSGGNCSTVVHPTTINISNVRAIASGDYHSLVLKQDGTVWGWGSTSGGQLAVLNFGSSSNYISVNPIQLTTFSGIKDISAKGSHNVALDADNNVWEWGGDNRDATPRKISTLGPVSKISAGQITSLALLSDGTVWQWWISNVKPRKIENFSDVSAIAAGINSPSLAIIGNPNILGTSTAPTPTDTPTPTPTATPTPSTPPTPSISPTPTPFLIIPFDYKSKNLSFSQVAYNPGSWFDHTSPNQSLDCCIHDTLIYTGERLKVAYKTHSGYDYNSQNGVSYQTPVLAAASGWAEYKTASESGGGGNEIRIDHGNGYETWYEHLDDNGLLEKDGKSITTKGVKIFVEQGEKIGETGFTGNVFPKDKQGAHIHLSVLKATDNKGNFVWPYSLVDPLGWVGSDTDPWTQKNGEASYNLFIDKIPQVQDPIPTSGGTLTFDKVQVTAPQGVAPVFFTISANYGPYESDQNGYESALPSLFLSAKDNLGQAITQFLQPITIVYNYASADLKNLKENTLKLFYYNEQTNQWDALPSTVNTDNKTVSAQTSHFSHFALMAEVIDKIAPTTTVALSGIEGQTNLYHSDVVVSLSAKDNEGGLGVSYTAYKVDNNNWQPYGSVITLNTEGQHTIQFYTEDVVGNIEDIQSNTFTIDKTSPESSSTITEGTKGNNDWYTSDVSLVLSATDERSGIAKIKNSLDGGDYIDYSEPLIVSKEGTNSLKYYAVDNAGNEEQPHQESINIDKTPPNTKIYTTWTKGTMDWYGSDVLVSLSADDAGSGTSAIYYKLDDGEYAEYDKPFVISKEGLTKLMYYSVDQAGNREVAHEHTFTIDKTPPTIHATRTSPNINGWNNDAVMVQFTCDDDSSGIETCTPATQVSGEGKDQSITGTAVDKAGNTASVTVGDINIDKTKPVITYVGRTPANNYGWNNADVTVYWTCSDALSGPVSSAVSDIVGAEGANLSANGTCIDKAGNSDSDTQSGIQIDKTPPHLAPVVSPSPVLLKGIASATAGASDALSDIASQSCNAVITTTVGSQVVNCTATDKAGNEAAGIANYAVIYRFDGFLQPINDTGHVSCGPSCQLSVFKGGSTVPVKFLLKDASGAVVRAASLPQWVKPQRGSSISAAIDESVYADPVTGGEAYYWDGEQYHYNWGTRGVSVGYVQRIGVLLDDGQTYTVSVGLR